METCGPLIRAFLRAFYPDSYCVVIEPLLREPFYVEDDDQIHGTLTRAMGGEINAHWVRGMYKRLVDHSLVLCSSLGVKGNEEEESGLREGRRRTQHTFYYIDFIHFIKIAMYRVSQMQTEIAARFKVDISTVDFYACPLCKRKYNMHEAQTRISGGMLLCKMDDVPLEEVQENEASSSTGNGGAEELKAKFLAQMSGARDLRDGINEYLQVAKKKGKLLEANNPEKTIKLEQAALQRKIDAENLASGKGGASANTDAAFTVTTAQRMATEQKSWLQISSVTGEQTEEAILDEKERARKRPRVDQNSVQNQDDKQDEYMKNYDAQLRHLKEMAAATPAPIEEDASVTIKTTHIAIDDRPKSSDAVFTFEDGRSVVAMDMTESTLEEFEDRCSLTEYENFMQFVSEHCAHLQ